MLRPSRPMMRPFISSDGRSTMDTVVALAWLAAVRWMPMAMMLRTRRSDSCLASASILRTSLAMSWRTCSSVSRRSWSRACCVVMPATRSRSRTCCSLMTLSSSCTARAWASRSSMPCSRRSSSCTLLSTPSSRPRVRSSILASSVRRSSSAASASCRISSMRWRTSMSASRRTESASRRASASRRSASSVSAAVRAPASFWCTRYPAPAPTSRPATMPTTTRISIVLSSAAALGAPRRKHAQCDRRRLRRRVNLEVWADRWVDDGA